MTRDETESRSGREGSKGGDPCCSSGWWTGSVNALRERERVDGRLEYVTGRLRGMAGVDSSGSGSGGTDACCLSGGSTSSARGWGELCSLVSARLTLDAEASGVRGLQSRR
jgi:hypothetical protein